MSTSKFCLAPTGGGHGKRQVLVGRFGCIPVPITDFVLQPFQPELNWTAFAVEALEDDIPSLHERLAAVSEGQLAGMQRSLACASRHLWWSSVWGGLFGEDGRYDAFATLMEILRLRIKYPDAAPQDYLRLDERWRKFAACELGDDGAGGKQARRGGESFSLCTYSADPGSEAVAPTALCPAAGGAYGHPGGAVCVGAPHVAACPRPWQ